MRRLNRFRSGVFGFYPHVLSRFADGGDGGGGGSGGGDGGGDDIEARIRSAVERETAGLKKARDEFRAEKDAVKKRLSELQSQLESIGGDEGLKRLSDLHKKLSADEVGKLLAEGKHDEWFEKRSAAMRTDYEKKLDAAAKAAESALKDRDAAINKYSTTMIDLEIQRAATGAGVVPSAVADVQLRGRMSFTYDDTYGPVIKEKDGSVVMGKDGKTPKTPAEWIEEQRDVSRHWWPQSESADAAGSGAGGSGGAMNPKRLMAMSNEDFKKAIGLK